jgi:hypothetical protein
LLRFEGGDCLLWVAIYQQIVSEPSEKVIMAEI